MVTNAIKGFTFTPLPRFFVGMTLARMIRDFLNDPSRKGLISIRDLEQRAGLPDKTLAHYLAGRRETLPKKHLPKLLECLEPLGFAPPPDE